MAEQRETLDKERLFDMSPLSDEFVAIHTLFKETLGAANMDRVQRVENGQQHETYSLYKRDVELEMGSTYNLAKHVRLLFHSTSEEAVESIIQSNTAGFLPMLAGSWQLDLLCS